MKLKLIALAVSATMASSVMAMDDIKNTDNMDAATSGLYNAGNTYEGLVNADSRFTFDMLNNFYVMNQQKKLLRNRQMGVLKNNTINLGGKGEVFAQANNTNSDLTASSLKTAGILKGNKTGVSLPALDIQVTGVSGDWLTGYFHMQANDPVVGGQKAGLTNSDSSLFVKDAMVVVGNLDESPVYFFGGTGIVNFGQFTSPSTIDMNLTRQVFMAHGGQLGLGYESNFADNQNFNVTGTLMNSAGLSDVNTGGVGKEQVGNFALNVEYTGDFVADNGFGFSVGAGYINSSAFESYSSSRRNGAYNLNGSVNFGDLDNQIQVHAELTRTLKDVNGFGNNAFVGNGDVYGAAQILGVNFTQLGNGSRANGVSLNADYSTQLFDEEKETVFYGMFDSVKADKSVSTYGFGARTNLLATLWIGASYNYSVATTSADDVNNHIIALDATAYF